MYILPRCTFQFDVTRRSCGFAHVFFLVVLEVSLTKIIVAFVTMPSRQSVAYHALSYGFVIVIILSRLCSCFLLPRLGLHRLGLKELRNAAGLRID